MKRFHWHLFARDSQRLGFLQADDPLGLVFCEGLDFQYFLPAMKSTEINQFHRS